jgi:hypothetical protein
MIIFFYFYFGDKACYLEIQKKKIEWSLPKFSDKMVCMSMLSFYFLRSVCKGDEECEAE